MVEAIKGDALTTQEIKQRGIKIVDGTRGGIELHAPTYQNTIANILQERGFLEANHVAAACDYLELKNSVYGFLNVKTMAMLLQTGEAGFKRSHAQEAYYIAMRHIGRNKEKVIILALNDQADDSLSSIAAVEAYRIAFKAAWDAMDYAKRIIAEQIEKELAYA